MQKKSSIHPSKYWIYYAIKLSCKKDDDDCLMIFTTSFPLKTRITLSTTTTAAIHCYLAIATHLHPTDSIRIFFFFWWWKNKERTKMKENLNTFLYPRKEMWVSFVRLCCWMKSTKRNKNNNNMTWMGEKNEIQYPLEWYKEKKQTE